MKKLTAAVALAGLSLSGCSSSERPDEEAGKYDQTWPYSYSDTTCSDWLSDMDDHQQFVAAADMLLGARSHDGVDQMVSDGMITDFADGISYVCIEPTMPIADAAVGLYLTEPQFQP